MKSHADINHVQNPGVMPSPLSIKTTVLIEASECVTVELCLDAFWHPCSQPLKLSVASKRQHLGFFSGGLSLGCWRLLCWQHRVGDIWELQHITEMFGSMTAPGSSPQDRSPRLVLAGAMLAGCTSSSLPLLFPLP